VDIALKEREEKKERSNIPVGKISEIKDKKDEDFPYKKLIDHKPELWENLK
jgi:hypothetical protein